MKLQFDFSSIKDKASNFSFKDERVKNFLKLLIAIVIGYFMFKGCGREETQEVIPAPQAIIDTTNDTVRKKETETKSTPTNYQPKKTGVRAINDHVVRLLSHDELKNYSEDQIRDAYFEALDHWFNNFLLKEENDELPNFIKYIE